MPKTKAKAKDKPRKVKSDEDKGIARLGPLSDAIRATAQDRRGEKPSNLTKALEFLGSMEPSPFKRRPLPHINDVALAFHQFHQKASSISINSVRNPAEWKSQMAVIREELQGKLEDMGLADLIDWTNPEEE